jgi:hypothetical protein
VLPPTRITLPRTGSRPAALSPTCDASPLVTMLMPGPYVWGLRSCDSETGIPCVKPLPSPINGYENRSPDSPGARSNHLVDAQLPAGKGLPAGLAPSPGCQRPLRGHDPQRCPSFEVIRVPGYETGARRRVAFGCFNDERIAACAAPGNPPDNPAGRHGWQIRIEIEGRQHGDTIPAWEE